MNKCKFENLNVLYVYYLIVLDMNNDLLISFILLIFILLNGSRYDDILWFIFVIKVIRLYDNLIFGKFGMDWLFYFVFC